MKYFSIPLFRAPALFLSAVSAICLPWDGMDAIAQRPQMAAQPPVAAAQPLLLDRAHVLESHGQIDLAVQTWKQILLVAPNDPQALRGLARAARLSGDEALASTYLSRLPVSASRMKNPASGESISLHEDVSLYSKQAVSSQALPATGEQSPGSARPGQQNGAQTARSSTRSRMNPTKGESRSALVTAEDGSSEGRAKDQDPRPTEQGSLHAAEIRYRTVLAARPSNPEALAGLGETLLQERQAAAAIPYFTHLVKLQASSTPAWRGLFLAELRAGEAIRALRTEHLMPPANRAELGRDPAFLCGLATAYIAMGLQADALQSLQNALKLPFRADPMGTEAAARLQYAGLLQASNHLDQAADLYRQLLVSDHEDTLAWRGLVRAEHGMNQDKQAMQTIESMSAASYASAIQEPVFAAIAASLYRSQRRLQLEATASAGPTPTRPLAVLPVLGLGGSTAARRVEVPPVPRRALAAPGDEMSDGAPTVAPTPERRFDKDDRSPVPKVASHTTSATTRILPRERPATAHANTLMPAAVTDARQAAAAGSPAGSSTPQPVLNPSGAAPVVPQAAEVFGPYVPFKPLVVAPAPTVSTPLTQKAPSPLEEMESVPILNLLPTATPVLNTAWLPDRSLPHPIALRQMSSLLPLSGESKPPPEEYSTPAIEGAPSASQR